MAPAVTLGAGVLEEAGRSERRWLVPLGWLALVAASASSGVVVAAAADRLGPAVVGGGAAAAAAGVLTLAAPWVGPAVIAASFPVGSAAVASLPLEVVEAAVLAVAGLLVLRRLADGHLAMVWAPQLAWVLALVAWAVAITPSAVDLGAAVRQDAALLGGALTVAAVLAASRGLDDVRRWLAAVVLIGGALAAVGAASSGGFDAVLGAAAVEGRPTGVFTSPNQLGGFVAMIACLGTGLAVGGRGTVQRALGGIGAVVALVALVLTLSRGAWLGMAVAVLWLLFAVPDVRRAVLRLGVPLLVAAALVTALALPAAAPQLQVIQDRFVTLADPADNPYDARPAIWREAGREIAAAPLTGHGPGSFPIASRRAVSSVRTVGALHAHNLPLTIAAEFGLPGLLLVLGLGASLTVLALRAVRGLPDPADRAVVAGLAAALIVQIGHGTVDFTLRNAVIATLTWMVVGGLLVAGRSPVTARLR